MPQDVYRIKDLTVYGKIIDIKLLRDEELSFDFKTDSLKKEGKTLVRNVKFLCKIKETEQEKIRLTL